MCQFQYVIFLLKNLKWSFRIWAEWGKKSSHYFWLKVNEATQFMPTLFNQPSPFFICAQLSAFSSSSFWGMRSYYIIGFSLHITLYCHAPFYRKVFPSQGKTCSIEWHTALLAVLCYLYLYNYTVIKDNGSMITMQSCLRYSSRALCLVMHSGASIAFPIKQLQHTAWKTH